MRQIYRDVAEKIPGFEGKNEHHVSLLYGNVECNNLKNIMPELEKHLPGIFTVSEFRIIALNTEVKNWKTLYIQTI